MMVDRGYEKLNELENLKKLTLEEYKVKID